MLQRCNIHDDTDRISDMPNDILISIISRLTLREATATSVLSSRWRHLHHHLTRLDFPPFKPLGESYLYFKSEVGRFRNHVNTINRVMDSHRGNRSVKELKLHMPKLEGGSIKKWVEFAFTKEIETIDITLHWYPVDWFLMYNCKIYQYKRQLSRLLTKTGHSQPLPAMKCLKRLTLVLVDLTDQDFDLLVNNFPLLEALRVHRPGKRLRNVLIVGHPKLKHIDLHLGSELKSFKIRGVMNLVYLRCYSISSVCALELENLPKLTKLHMNEDGWLPSIHDELFAKIACCIRDQVELLSLQSCIWGLPKDRVLQPFQFVTVRRLELVVDPLRDHSSSHRFRPLIEACPSLGEAKIKFSWSLCNVQKILEEMPEKKADEYDPHHKKLSPNFKVLELEGYVGYGAEFELSSYVINYAVNLERVIVVSCAATQRIRRKVSERASSDFRLITPLSLELQIK